MIESRFLGVKRCLLLFVNNCISGFDFAFEGWQVPIPNINNQYHSLERQEEQMAIWFFKDLIAI